MAGKLTVSDLQGFGDAPTMLGKSTVEKIRRAVEKIEKIPEGIIPQKDAPYSGGPSFRLFELTEDLTGGSTSEAKLVVWDTVGEDWEVIEDELFDVTDFVGTMTGEVGARGIAISLFGKWVILQISC